MFKKEDEEDQEFQGDAALSTGARQLLELTPLQPCAEEFDFLNKLVDASA